MTTTTARRCGLPASLTGYCRAVVALLRRARVQRNLLLAALVLLAVRDAVRANCHYRGCLGSRAERDAPVAAAVGAGQSRAQAQPEARVDGVARRAAADYAALRGFGAAQPVGDDLPASRPPLTYEQCEAQRRRQQELGGGNASVGVVPSASSASSLAGARICSCDRKVFGLGLSRTGTTTLFDFMRRLGRRCAHWDRRVNEVVRKRIRRGEPIADNDFCLYDAIDFANDFPVAWMYHEAAAVYPRSVFILNERDEASWWRSVRAHYARVDHRLLNQGRRASCEDPATTESELRCAVYGSATPHEWMWRKRYRQHYQEVRQSVHPERLLVVNLVDDCFDAGEAERALCEFAGVEHCNATLRVTQPYSRSAAETDGHAAAARKRCVRREHGASHGDVGA